MASDYFDFKQFRVYHNQCAMKVGTDSVLLGALIPQIEDVSTILDIGTGSGILALMLAQRFSKATLDAIEIDLAAANQALNNFEQSRWHSRLKVYHQGLQEFSKDKKYQLIVSNPPYFVLEDAYKMADSSRRDARYTHTLTHHELLSNSINLMDETSSLFVILPSSTATSFVQFAKGFGLNQTVEVAIKMKPKALVSRYILGFSLVPKIMEQSEFVVYDEFGKRSAAYNLVTSDFYL